MHDAFRVSNALDEAGVRRLAGFGIELERWSQSTHHKVAHPAIFLIDRAGVIRFAHASRYYASRPPVDAVIERVKQALGGPAAPGP